MSTAIWPWISLANSGLARSRELVLDKLRDDAAEVVDQAADELSNQGRLLEDQLLQRTDLLTEARKRSLHRIALHKATDDVLMVAAADTTMAANATLTARRTC